MDEAEAEYVYIMYLTYLQFKPEGEIHEVTKQRTVTAVADLLERHGYTNIRRK